jgi:coiled-coil domain-containing protein 130
MLRKRKLVHITRHPYFPFDANVTYATAGSRYTQIRRQDESLDVGGSVLMCESQNTRYVVATGARKKDEEWDPEENGGFAIHGIIIHPSADYMVTPWSLRF